MKTNTTATTTTPVVWAALDATTKAIVATPLPAAVIAKIRHLLADVYGGNDNIVAATDQHGFLRWSTISPESPPRASESAQVTRDLYRYECGTEGCQAIWTDESHRLFCRSCGQAAETRTRLGDDRQRRQQQQQQTEQRRARNGEYQSRRDESSQ